MGKRDEKIAQYTAAAKELKLDLSDDLIAKVTVGLGPSIYKKDSETVSCTQASELETVKKNYLVKKLGLDADDAKLDAAIKEVCEAMGSSNRNKYRALFYALLCKGVWQRVCVRLRLEFDEEGIDLLFITLAKSYYLYIFILPIDIYFQHIHHLLHIQNQ